MVPGARILYHSQTFIVIFQMFCFVYIIKWLISIDSNFWEIEKLPILINVVQVRTADRSWMRVTKTTFCDVFITYSELSKHR